MSMSGGSHYADTNAKMRELNQKAADDLIEKFGKDFIEIQPTELMFEEVLGSGAFGMACLCRYTGDNNKVKDLCVNGYIALKLPYTQAFEANKQELLNEKKIENYIAAVGLKGDLEDTVKEGRTLTAISKNSNVNYNVGAGIVVNGAPLIISRVEAFDLDENGKPRSIGDLDGLFEKIEEKTRGVDLENSTIKNKSFYLACKNNKALLQMQLLADAYKSISELHDAGYVHVDGDLRNIMAKGLKLDPQGNFVKLSAGHIDFGISKPYDPKTGIATEKLSDKNPLLIIDDSVYKGGIASVKTDLYCSKILISEIVAKNAGRTLNSVAMIDRDTGFENNSYYYKRQAKGDEETLKMCFYRAANLAQQSADSRLMLYAYQDYLLKMPSGSSPSEYRKQDASLRQAGNDCYFKMKLFQVLDQHNKEPNMSSLKDALRILNTFDVRELEHIIMKDLAEKILNDDTSALNDLLKIRNNQDNKMIEPDNITMQALGNFVKDYENKAKSELIHLILDGYKDPANKNNTNMVDIEKMFHDSGLRDVLISARDGHGKSCSDLVVEHKDAKLIGLLNKHSLAPAEKLAKTVFGLQPDERRSAMQNIKKEYGEAVSKAVGQEYKKIITEEVQKAKAFSPIVTGYASKKMERDAEPAPDDNNSSAVKMTRPMG